MEIILKFIISVAVVGFTGLLAALLLEAPIKDKKHEKLYEIAAGVLFYAVVALELYYIWF